MATIAFYPLHEPGHLIPTLPLARRLAARGHRIVYGTTLDLGTMVVAHGFEHVPVLRDVVPAGYAARVATAPLDELDALNRVMWLREDRELFDGRLLDRFLTVAPDLLLIDTICPLFAMAARERGVPFLRYSTSLSQRLDDGTPPITTALPHDAPPVQRQVARWSSSCLGVWSWTNYEHALPRFGIAPEDVSFASTFMGDLVGEPELVLPPAALDLPRPPSSTSIHVGVPVDLERAEHVDPALERFLDGRPLIYVSLGSMAHRYPAAAALIDAIFAAARARPDWQVVVVVGERREALAPSCPSNVLLVSWAPQLWVLRRTAVFVTHGGMGAFREAVGLCVPMVVIPQGFDQPGNAARVEHHGLGVHLPREVVDPARLLSCLDRVLAARESYRERLRQIERACAAETERDLAVQLVEQQLGAAPARVESAEPPRVVEHTVEPLAGWLWLPADGYVGGRGPVTTTDVLVAGPGEVISLGRGGFTICPDLGEALARAQGAWLWRVELGGVIEREGPYLTGSTLRGLWRLEAGALLFELARRCVALALEAERASRPEIVDYFLSGLARHHAGTDLRAELERVATPLRHRGFDVGFEALASAPHHAAMLARDALIQWRCRAALRDVAPSTAAYNEARTRIAAELDADLFRSVMAAAAAVQ